ncbi:MAG: tRNA 2-thiouridine(34) synthase MnmA [Candidatus Falkowbacteria bacterium]|nr:tRNA 2-thiouridine(34) synthase MnmA [Candidatus Falkowbacteria bacterium]
MFKIKKQKKRVLVAMSGGVDSSVAAKLLLDQGYEVAGVFLRFWKDPQAAPTEENKCCSLQSFLDAKAVCGKIGIPLYSFDFSDSFKEEVVDYFLDSYANGKTPNPCIRCNRKIKLGRLLEMLPGLGFDYLATGHYANIKHDHKESRLYRAKDDTKDQSYFLYSFEQEKLSKLLFPLGNLKKTEVRKLAARFGLPTASKQESQDICFLSGAHQDFLRRYLKLTPGPIKLLDSEEEIGQHQGLPLYTIGQRKGIEIGGIGPFYAAKLDYPSNTLYVVKDWDGKFLYQQECIAHDLIWCGQVPKKNFNCQAVIRYGHPAEACKVEVSDREILVKFKKAQRAITPGQSIVFYQKSQVLGGGIIS